jgi:hypothetical protein
VTYPKRFNCPTNRPPSDFERFAGCGDPLRCRTHALPFKATAGLHHALFDGVNHGFLNVLAATFVSTGDARQQVLRELRATTLDGLSLPRSASDAARVRRAFVSFGSCSVDEPVDDLTALRMLG